VVVGKGFTLPSGPHVALYKPHDRREDHWPVAPSTNPLIAPENTHLQFF
jgi:hypothetical protein